MIMIIMIITRRMVIMIIIIMIIRIIARGGLHSLEGVGVGKLRLGPVPVRLRRGRTSQFGMMCCR